MRGGAPGAGGTEAATASPAAGAPARSVSTSTWRGVGEDGQAAARACGLMIVAQLKKYLGDLSRVERIVKLGVFVNSHGDFTDQPKVANGASELMAQVFGDAVQHQHGTTTPLLLQRAIRAMCVYVEQNPAAVALCLTGGADGPGRVMNDRLVEFANLRADLLEPRVARQLTP